MVLTLNLLSHNITWQAKQSLSPSLIDQLQTFRLHGFILKKQTFCFLNFKVGLGSIKKEIKGPP